MTLFMTGLIWLIQILHYPSYRFIDRLQFSNYQNFHVKNITLVVGPIMLIEVFSGLYLLLQNNFNLFFSINFIGLLIIWVSTLIFSVPNHNKLHLGYQESTITQLNHSNWIRTLLWTTRSFLLSYILLGYLK
jgi:hypothetical protein